MQVGLERHRTPDQLRAEVVGRTGPERGDQRLTEYAVRIHARRALERRDELGPRADPRRARHEIAGDLISRRRVDLRGGDASEQRDPEGERVPQ